MKKKPTVSRTMNVYIEVPVPQLANFFWMLDSSDKILFFNELAEQTEDWFGSLEECNPDIEAFINSPMLTEGAKRILSLLKPAI